MRILITGAQGFIGETAVTELAQRNYQILAVTRKPPLQVRSTEPTDQITWIQSSDYTTSDRLTGLLPHVDAVIHLAAYAHLGRRKASQLAPEIFRFNTHKTICFANQCAAAGVRTFIFLSSVGVNGHMTASAPFTEDDAPQPCDVYTLSKHRAELGLQDLASTSTMKVITIRAPLVYGARAKGKFASLVALIKRRIPLPFAGLRNERSLLGVNNLANFLALALNKSNTLGPYELFLLSDTEVVSTPTIVKQIAKSLGVKDQLFWVPPVLIRSALALPCLKRVTASLTGSLVIDSTKARSLLQWAPPLTLQQQLARLER